MSETLNLPDRIYAQYADKPKFVEWMNITRKIGLELKEGAEQVRKCFDIETAKGDALEVISRIVVVDRIKDERLMNAGVFSDPDGTNFDDQEKIFAEWSTYTNASLSDEMLRFAIKAKIIKNTANPTADELLSALASLFPNANVLRLINYHDMSFAIEYTGKLSALEQWLSELHDFIPTPQGVEFRGVIRTYGMIEFLSDDENSSFGDEELEFLE